MHDPRTCPECDLAGLETHMAMLLPLEQIACDLDAWMKQYRPSLRNAEATLVQHALQGLIQALQTIHDR
jgi:hypothetical protein